MFIKYSLWVLCRGSRPPAGGRGVRFLRIVSVLAFGRPDAQEPHPVHFVSGGFQPLPGATAEGPRQRATLLILIL